MEFYTQNGNKRPIRLSEETRKFAHESLNRKYGLDTLKTMSVSLDDIENIGDLSPLEKYDLAIGYVLNGFFSDDLFGLAVLSFS